MATALKIDIQKTDACRRLTDAYRNFSRSRAAREFISRGGTVTIASEGRAAGQISTLYDAGHRHFAEKFVQEAEKKTLFLRNRCPEISLSFYGHLQRNKCRRALQIFDSVESIGRGSLALKIASLLEEDPSISVDSFFIQLNTGKEPQKSGVFPEKAQELIDFCLNLDIPVAGLMAIPPKDEDPAPHFRFLRKLADANNLKHCQMGMSDDWRVAVEEGATLIRIGRLIFGEGT